MNVLRNTLKHPFVGGGLAGASAAEDIRELDAAGSILLVGELLATMAYECHHVPLIPIL